MSSTTKDQPVTPITDEVVLVPTQSGDILEDKGKITLEISPPDSINPQLIIPSQQSGEDGVIDFANRRQVSAITTPTALEELIFTQYQQLIAAEKLLPLDKNDFATNLSKVLSVLVSSELINQQAETILSATSFITTNDLILKQQLAQKMQLNLSLGLKLHTGITALFNDFVLENNWPRLLAAWQILIQPTNQQLVGKTSWLEILAKQALMLLGEYWQQQALSFLKENKQDLSLFFKDYFASNEYLGVSLGITDSAQLRSFLTPIVLSLPAAQLFSEAKPKKNKSVTKKSQPLTTNTPTTSQQAFLGLLKKQEAQHQERLSKLQQEFSLVQGKLNQLLTSKNQQQHLQKQLQTSRKDLLTAKLEQSKAQLELRQLHQLKQQNSDYQKTTQELEQKTAQLQSKIEKLNSKLGGLQQENQELEKYLSKLDSENEHLRQLRDAGVPATALKQQVALLQESQLQDQKNLQVLRQQNEQLQLALAAANQEKWRLQQQNIFASKQKEVLKEASVVKQSVNNAPTQVTAQPVRKKTKKSTMNFLNYGEYFMPPAAPEFSSTTSEKNSNKLVESSSLSIGKLSLLVKQKRLSRRFPLCSRSGRELSFTILSAQLERVLGGSLYALQKAGIRRTRLK